MFFHIMQSKLSPDHFLVTQFAHDLHIVLVCHWDSNARNSEVGSWWITTLALLCCLGPGATSSSFIAAAGDRLCCLDHRCGLTATFSRSCFHIISLCCSPSKKKKRLIWVIMISKCVHSCMQLHNCTSEIEWNYRIDLCRRLNGVLNFIYYSSRHI